MLIERRTKLLLVRHAETDDNMAMRLSGWTDSHLSERGERQVRLLATHFNGAHSSVAEIYSSPLVRARRTAEAIAELTGHSLILLDDLREMYFGDLDGRPYEELKEAHADLLAGDEDAEREDFVWPNGESRSGFATRSLSVVNQISRAHRGESVAIVTHGGIISVFLALMKGESTANWRRWTVPNASLTEVVWDPESGTGDLIRHGEYAHLGPLEPAAAWEEPKES